MQGTRSKRSNSTDTVMVAKTFAWLGTCSQQSLWLHIIAARLKRKNSSRSESYLSSPEAVRGSKAWSVKFKTPVAVHLKLVGVSNKRLEHKASDYENLYDIWNPAMPKCPHL